MDKDIENIKIENIKDGCKITMPIITYQELDKFNNMLNIETEFEKMIKKVNKQIYKERECILLQQIIKKQDQKIDNIYNYLRQFKYDMETGGIDIDYVLKIIKE